MISHAIAVYFSLMKASGGAVSLFGIVYILLPAVSLRVVEPVAVDPAYLKDEDLWVWVTVEFALA